MDFIDSIVEGIGNVVLIIFGIVIFLLGGSMMSRHEAIGFLVVIMGLCVIVSAKSYSK